MHEIGARFHPAVYRGSLQSQAAALFTGMSTFVGELTTDVAEEVTPLGVGVENLPVLFGREGEVAVAPLWNRS